MSRKIWALLTVSLALGPARQASAGDLVYVSAGGGPSDGGIGGLLSLSVVRESRVLGFRIATSQEFEIFGPVPSEGSSDYAFLIGKASRGRFHLSTVTTGIAWVQTVERGRVIQPGVWFFGPVHERIERHTIGVPFDVATSVHLQGVGLGLHLFGNLNTARSFGGLAVSVQLGKVR